SQGEHLHAARLGRAARRVVPLPGDRDDLRRVREPARRERRHRAHDPGRDPVMGRVRRLDDLVVGERLLVGRTTPSREEAIELALRVEPTPYRLDEEAGRQSIYGVLTLCSLRLFAIATRLFFDMEEPIATLAMLGKDEVRLPRPARPGEELRYFTTCIEK